MRYFSPDNINFSEQSLMTAGTGSYCKHFAEELLMYYKSKRVILYLRNELGQYDIEDRNSIEPSLKYCEARDVACYQNCYKVTKDFYHASNINIEWLREEESKKLLEAQT